MQSYKDWPDQARILTGAPLFLVVLGILLAGMFAFLVSEAYYRLKWRLL